MILKTKGIVLHHIKYRESGLIIHVFTPDLGRQSLLIQGIKSRSKKEKASLFQPLYILDLEIYHKPGQSLHRIKEARNHKPYISIPHNIVKTSIAVFLSELLYNCLKTEEKEAELFDFLINSFQVLDHCDSGITNFHLVFLLKLTRFLGFYPNTGGLADPFCFDLRDGLFRASPPNHPFYLSQAQTHLFLAILEHNLHGLKDLNLNNDLRSEMLEHIIDYYNLHEQNVGSLKSIKFLKEVFK